MIPVPPLSAMSTGSAGSGAKFSISSNANSSAGSMRAPAERAASFRAVSTRSSMNAATRAAAAPEPLPVASRYRVPLAVRNSSGSNASSGSGETASRTRGSARAAKAKLTPCQIESLCGGRPGPSRRGNREGHALTGAEAVANDIVAHVFADLGFVQLHQCLEVVVDVFVLAMEGVDAVEDALAWSIGEVSLLARVDGVEECY